ncbi:MAG: hypothetical protein D6730_24135 [Bacteroidetes bacterium]|nr:MAG: hypothetical protein D6730_24135 [Bacteroidota bacterium]
MRGQDAGYRIQDAGGRSERSGDSFKEMQVAGRSAAEALLRRCRWQFFVAAQRAFSGAQTRRRCFGPASPPQHANFNMTASVLLGAFVAVPAGALKRADGSQPPARSAMI